MDYELAPGSLRSAKEIFPASLVRPCIAAAAAAAAAVTRRAASTSRRPSTPCLLQGDKAAHNFLSEAVVRSLPKGLTTAERERVMASTPLSPTLNLLSSMPLVGVA